MIDYLNNVESEYRGIRRTLRTAAAKNHVILRHLYRFLPEESDKLGCHAGVIQVTLSLTHDNSYVVDWRISIFRVADPSLVRTKVLKDNFTASLTLVRFGFR